jgi:hypothetical protein
MTIAGRPVLQVVKKTCSADRGSVRIIYLRG